MVSLPLSRFIGVCVCVCVGICMWSGACAGGVRFSKSNRNQNVFTCFQHFSHYLSLFIPILFIYRSRNVRKIRELWDHENWDCFKKMNIQIKMTSLYSVSKYYSTNNIVANMQWISDISPSPSWCCDWVACRLSPLWWKCFFSRVVFSPISSITCLLMFPVRALWDMLQGMYVCVYFPVHCILFDLRSCVSTGVDSSYSVYGLPASRAQRKRPAIAHPL